MSGEVTVRKKFLLIAGFPDSLINFRGPLLCELLAKGLEVHVVAPDLPNHSAVRQQLEAWGVYVHQVTLKRTGMNPLVDLVTALQLWCLMRRIKPDYTLGYTIKPAIYGSFAAWLSGVPNRFSLITGLGYVFQGEAGKRSWLKLMVQGLYRVALSKAKKVFFQNPDDEGLFQKLDIVKKIDQKTVVVNGSGVDVDNYTVAPFPEKVQ